MKQRLAKKILRCRRCVEHGCHDVGQIFKAHDLWSRNVTRYTDGPMTAGARWGHWDPNLPVKGLYDL